MMNCSQTLRIRKLPGKLTEFEIIDLLKHFGATQVNIVGNTKNITAFAIFSNVDAARICLKRLHQLEILGELISVDFAPTQSTDTNPSFLKGHGSSEGRYEKFLCHLNSWTAGVNLTQPPPPHLRYQYPPPSLTVVSNIAKALTNIPKFYTQVVHLMNKMNLPSPFSESSDPILCIRPSNIHHIQLYTDSTGVAGEEVAMQTSTSESELESDGECVHLPENLSVPVKRPSSTKRVAKRSKLIQSSVSINKIKQPTVPIKEVFEVSSDVGRQKRIELRLVGVQQSNERNEPVASSTEPLSDPTTEGFGVLFPPVPEPVEIETLAKTDGEEDCATITISQLRSNRLSERDRSMMPVFRGWQAGPPSCRLYVKNLSKSVTSRELHFIFRAFLNKQESQDSFDIRLMSEGRMRGQAFITFSSEAEASKALKESNGYLLKDRPMVVQFARSAAAKAKPMLE